MRRQPRVAATLRLATTLVALALVLGAASSRAEPTDTSASTGTLRGSVSSALRPSQGAIVTARAISILDGTTFAVARVRSTASYRFVLAPGRYLVLVEKAGPALTPVTGFGRIAAVLEGKTATVPRIAPGSATRTTSSLSAAASGASVVGTGAPSASQPAIAVRQLSGTGPKAYLGRGLSSMLVTELFGSRCYVLVEWEQRNLILDEIRLQQSRWVDPSTRVTPHLIQPKYFVEGSVATTTGTASWNVRVRDRATGRVVASDSGSSANLIDAVGGIGHRLKKQIEEELCGFPLRFTGTFTGENRTAARNTYSGTITFVRDRNEPTLVSYRLESVSWAHRMTSLPTSPCQVNASAQASAKAGGATTGVLVIQKQRTAKGYGYAIAAGFASPKQLTVTFVCNGVPSQQPWIPGGGLNSSPPSLDGGGSFTDGKTIKGRYESAGTASTYTWNLKGSG